MISRVFCSGIFKILESDLPSGMAGCPPGAAPVVPWAPISDGTGASAALNFLAASEKNQTIFKTNLKIFEL